MPVGSDWQPSVHSVRMALEPSKGLHQASQLITFSPARLHVLLRPLIGASLDLPDPRTRRERKSRAGAWWPRVQWRR